MRADQIRWTHKPTVIDGRAERPDRDRVVLANGKPVGRIYKRTSNNDDVWDWMVWTYPSPTGYADTLELALIAVREAVLESEGYLGNGRVGFGSKHTNCPTCGKPLDRSEKSRG